MIGQELQPSEYPKKQIIIKTVQINITLEWPLDPFLVREGDHKLNFIPLKYLFFTYDLHVPPVPF